MVMPGSADNASQWGRQVAQPDEIGMRETQSPCVIVADTDAHYARAQAAGAPIVMDIDAQDSGGARDSSLTIYDAPTRLLRARSRLSETRSFRRRWDRKGDTPGC